MPLFDYSKFEDDYGAIYIELIGEVIHIGEPLSRDAAVKVKTNEGVFTGYYLASHLPKVGYFAKIRIYDSGGGWYPDDRIVAWSKDKNGLLMNENDLLIKED